MIQKAPEKYQRIKNSLTDIARTLGLGLNNDSLRETPHRIAKMYVDEISAGFDYFNFPEITVIDNKIDAEEMVKASAFRVYYLSVGVVVVDIFTPTIPACVLLFAKNHWSGIDTRHSSRNVFTTILTCCLVFPDKVLLLGSGVPSPNQGI